MGVEAVEEFCPPIATAAKKANTNCSADLEETLEGAKTPTITRRAAEKTIEAASPFLPTTIVAIELPAMKEPMRPRKKATDDVFRPARLTPRFVAAPVTWVVKTPMIIVERELVSPAQKTKTLAYQDVFPMAIVIERLPGLAVFVVLCS
jgi:hypothetical protein